MKFETFVTWLDSIVKQAEFLDLQPKVTKSVPSQNCSARLDVETPTKLGRITAWSSGDFHAEIVDLNTSTDLFSESGHLDPDIDSIPNQFQDFFNRIRREG
jgi:hypothetical protein